MHLLCASRLSWSGEVDRFGGQDSESTWCEIALYPHSPLFNGVLHVPARSSRQLLIHPLWRSGGLQHFLASTLLGFLPLFQVFLFWTRYRVRYRRFRRLRACAPK